LICEVYVIYGAETPKAPVNPSVAIIHTFSYQTPMLNSIRDGLPAFQFSYFDVSSSNGMPTLQQLLNFNATICTFGWAAIYSANSLGTLLYQYVSAGGNLIIMMENFGTNTGLQPLTIGSTFPSSYYAILPSANFRSSGTQFMIPLDTTHPILSGVSTYNGGPCSDRAGAWSSNAHQVASWGDGLPMIGTITIGNTRRVDISFFPIPNPPYSCGWPTSTTGFTILSNSLFWVMQKEHTCGEYDSCSSCTSNGNCVWCLDTASCTPIDYTCPNRVWDNGDCPNINCFQFNGCSNCVNDNNDNQCVWCLDNYSCVSANTTCYGEISDLEYCSSKATVSIN